MDPGGTKFKIVAVKELSLFHHLTVKLFRKLSHNVGKFTTD